MCQQYGMHATKRAKSNVLRPINRASHTRGRHTRKAGLLTAKINCIVNSRVR